jgi:hypothetical protein
MIADINEKTGPQGHQIDRYDYSCRCGWIDWGHAGADRPDLVQIRKQFPNPPIAGGTPLQRMRFQTTTQGKRVFEVRLQPGQVGGLGWPSPLAIRERRWTVEDCSGDRQRYLRKALSIFLEGCRVTELRQLQAFGQSGFSFEDMTSNLLAFYQALGGIRQEEIRRICKVVSRQESEALFNRMTDAQRSRTNVDPYQPILWHNRREFQDCCPSCRGVSLEFPRELTVFRGHPLELRPLQ